MDFSWTPYFNGFWVFPLLCLLFMAIMMIGCHGMRFRCGHGARKSESPEREAGKAQGDAMRRKVNG